MINLHPLKDNLKRVIALRLQWIAVLAKLKGMSFVSVLQPQPQPPESRQQLLLSPQPLVTTTEGPTTTTTPEPCVEEGVNICRYEYNGSTWSFAGGYYTLSCNFCSCPSSESIRNEWNSQNGGDPAVGQCAIANMPCCPSCFDYSVTFSEECPTTTTTTGGPTTTTTGSSTTTLEPNPTAVIHCLGGIPDCCDDPSLGVVKPENQGCCDESRGKRNLPRHCQDFPTNEEAFKFWQDVGQNHLAYIFTGYTCQKLETRISPPNFESTCQEL